MKMSAKMVGPKVVLIHCGDDSSLSCVIQILVLICWNDVVANE